MVPLPSSWRRTARTGGRHAVLLLVVGVCVACGGGLPGTGAGGPSGSGAPSTHAPSAAGAPTLPTPAATAADGAPRASSLPPVGAWHLPKGAQLQDPGPDEGALRTTAGGVVLLQTPPVGSDASASAPVEGTAGWTWTPREPLPAPQAAGRPVDVFYTPHPDDETLSMGVLIAAAVRRGDRVVLVSLTDGRTTGAIRPVNRRLATERRPGQPASVTTDQIAASREGELRRAAADLGVPAADVALAHLDDPASDDGAIVTVAEAETVIRVFAARFPGAMHVTMSDVAERQQDHLDAGVALHRSLAAGVVTAAQWTVSRLWWRQPSPAWRWELPTTQERVAVRHAAWEYQTWNPADGDYAVGFYSVRWQLAALERDVRNRVHGQGPSAAGVG